MRLTNAQHAECHKAFMESRANIIAAMTGRFDFYGVEMMRENEAGDWVIWQESWKASLLTKVVPRDLHGLLREARDNCRASIAEDGISDMRRDYRENLLRRLDKVLFEFYEGEST